jgi:hypothetical protein
MVELQLGVKLLWEHKLNNQNIHFKEFLFLNQKTVFHSEKALSSRIFTYSKEIKDNQGLQLAEQCALFLLIRFNVSGSKSGTTPASALLAAIAFAASLRSFRIRIEVLNTVQICNHLLPHQSRGPSFSLSLGERHR